MAAFADALALRPDIEIVPAESDAGRPALLLHDPVSGAFDRVEWPESDIIELLRRPTTFPALYDALRARNVLKPTPRDLGRYVSELGERGWLRGHVFWNARSRETRRGGFLRLFSRLMFVQLSLIRPAGFLRATAGAARLILNPFARFLLVACGLAGLYLALPRWEEYWRDCLASVSPDRIPSVAAAVIAVKIVHEFAHAYAATLAGARVPVMGVALMFCLPLPFTDVTDAWRLPWRQRLGVAAAGMAAEMAVAGMALLLWALSPPGEAALALARVSSIALLSTLLTNLNPGPRFDGYYMLCCLLRTENLRARGAGELRRLAWRVAFGIPDSGGDAFQAGNRRRGMLLYAGYAVFYRLSLGVGLALAAYYLLPRAAALPVVAIMVWLFCLGPILLEIVRVARNWRQMRPTPGMLVVLAALAGAGVWFFASLPRRVHFPGVARARVAETVRARRAGTVAEVAAERGMEVTRGQLLARLVAPEDGPRLRGAEWSLREAEMAEEQAWRSDEARPESAGRAAETSRRRVELRALRTRGRLLDVRAPASGTVVDWDRDFVPGVTVASGAALGWIAGGPVTLVTCYPDMAVAGRLDAGAAVRFFPDSGGGGIGGRVVRIERSRPEVLEDAELARVLGAVRSGDSLVLSRPYAKVLVELDGALPRNGQTGRMWAWTRPESLAEAAGRWLTALAVRESAF